MPSGTPAPSGVRPGPLAYRGVDLAGLGRPVGDPGGVGTVPAGSGPLLDVCDLSVSFATREGEVRAVDGVSFALGHGEVLAIVGESGSGKSVCAMTLMGLTRGPNTTISGRALFDGRDLIGAPEVQLRRVRGAQLAMVFQDPQSSLNPVYRVGDQIAEQIRAHEPFVSKAQALRRAGELMERARIPKAHDRVRAYPHELSGGMRQRVMIAMGLSLGAKVLLADEPTTALDVTVQAQILAELKDLREQEDLSIVLITHDFGVVADIADRVAVMQAGRVVEQASASEILERPRDPYTRGLLEALRPSAKARPTRARVAPFLEVEDLRVEHPGRGRRGGGIVALDGVSLSLAPGETLAIVGESGCGKTTLLRSIAGLVEPSAGTIRLGGQDLAKASRSELAAARRELGMVFQDPQASLSPRRSVGRTLERALRSRGLGAAEARSAAERLLGRVGLEPGQAKRFPHELSGGERQRVGIARALAGKPRLVLLDEPVSSLDASIRRGVIDLLDELQAESGCAYALVSHDFTTVEALADRIAVMYGGKVVEQGAAREVLERPTHPYTKELLEACPRLPGGVGSEAWTTQRGSFSA
ncbi:MAG TPA: ABC transporter ATP-binding protein [Solirubrobacteraceae bacterium]|nr:ABC transporter ATP-binding protein [Solirubrobacteraceae bacterium]